MSIVAAPPAPMAQVEFAPLQRHRTRNALFPCLVISSERRRSSMFERAAAESGWATHACDDPERAYLETRRMRFPLVIVDLNSDRASDGFRNLAEQLAREGGPLLMVCGVEDDALEEIWARQLGAWLYLPGVDETCDVAMLCSEAKRAVEKLGSCAA